MSKDTTKNNEKLSKRKDSASDERDPIQDMSPEEMKEELISRLLGEAFNSYRYGKTLGCPRHR